MKTLIFALLSMVGTSALAHTPVSTPVEESKTKYAKGHVFSVSGSSLDGAEGAIEAAESNLKWHLSFCASGKARQITAWETNRYEFKTPEDCIESNGQKFCRGGEQNITYIAGAKFRCL